MSARRHDALGFPDGGDLRLVDHEADETHAGAALHGADQLEHVVAFVQRGASGTDEQLNSRRTLYDASTPMHMRTLPARTGRTSSMRSRYATESTMRVICEASRSSVPNSANASRCTVG